MTCSPDTISIRALILDVDGVLTDGRIGYGNLPGEIKFFHVQDGQGLKLLLGAGLVVGLLSGRASVANRRRADELGLSFIHEGCADKAKAFVEILQQYGLEAGQCVYVGDDLADLPAMRLAGVAVAVANAVDEVKAEADMVCQRRGGEGAVREVAEWILKRLGRLEEAMTKYMEPGGDAQSAETQGERRDVESH